MIGERQPCNKCGRKYKRRHNGWCSDCVWLLICRDKQHQRYIENHRYNLEIKQREHDEIYGTCGGFIP
jgi:hypothetical protein